MNTLRTNVNAGISANALRIHNMQSVAAMNRLATGQKFSANNLNSSNYIETSNTTSTIRSLEMGAKNLNEAIALLQSIDTIAAQIQIALIDMKDKTMTVTGTLNSNYAGDNGFICDYVQWAQENIISMAEGHSFNGKNFMIGGGENNQTTTAMTFNVNTTGGGSAADSLQMTFKSFHPHSSYSSRPGNIYGDPDNPDLPILNASAGTDTHAYGNSSMYTIQRGAEGGWHTDNFDASQHSLIQMDRAIAGIGAERARIGGYISRLNQVAESNLDSVMQAKNHRSQVLDTDYAQEVTALSKSQILAQSATAILTQANKNKDSLLSLLH